MAKALFEQISATGAYIASLRGSRILDSAVRDRYEALKALVAQTPLTASAAAMAVNAIREIDWPLATTDKLIACVHDRMISPSSRDATGWKYQDFTNMPNFLTGAMWASRDILEPLCMLAAKMTLQTMNEDTAAVLAALVMAQQLGLEEAANASPQSQYDMVQLVKKKVKSYSGITLQSNMQVLPASADILLLHDAEIYHCAFPVDGPVSMPLDKVCFEKLVGLIPRRKSSIRLRGPSLLQQHVPQLQQQMPQMPMNMNMENIGALFKMFVSMSNRDDDPRLTILRDANNRGQNHLLDRPASAGSQHVDDPRGFVLDGPAGAIHGGQPGGNRLALNDLTAPTPLAGHPDSPKVVLPAKRKSIADATTELLASIGKKKTKKVASSEQDESDEDATDASSEPASAKKKKTKNQQVANGGKAKGGKAKGGKAKGGKAKAGNAKTYKLCNEPSRDQCRIRCSDSTSFSIPYRDHGNSQTRAVAAAKKWIAQH
jgi:hypothetical protein